MKKLGIALAIVGIIIIFIVAFTISNKSKTNIPNSKNLQEAENILRENTITPNTQTSEDTISNTNTDYSLKKSYDISNDWKDMEIIIDGKKYIL